MIWTSGSWVKFFLFLFFQISWNLFWRYSWPEKFNDHGKATFLLGSSCMHSKMTFHKDRLCGALKTLNVLLDLRARSSEFDKLHRPFQKIIYCNPKRSKSMNFTLKPDKDVFPLEWSTVHSHKKILKLNLFVTLKYQFYSLKWSLFVKLPGPVIIYRRGWGEGGGGRVWG